MKSEIEKIADDLYLIPLTPSIKGFQKFISAWLYRADATCLVDVGPSACASDLLLALQELEVNQIDYILLTHIHLDHAGAIGEIAESFPDTPIICHQDAIRHLVNPTRLWEGTLKVLGSMALAYGPIKSVPENRLQTADLFQTESVRPIITPGHAAHHVSYQTVKYLFAGETGGVFMSLPEDRFYLRPATPPRFFLGDALQSVDALIAGDPQTICYGHFGVHADAVKMLHIHREQLQLWEKLLGAEWHQFDKAEQIDGCMKMLIEEDPLMATFNQLPPDVQEREKYFLKNSIKGYLGYLDSVG